MKKLPILWNHGTQFLGELVWRGALFGTLVGVTEGVIIYLVMGAFGMFDPVAIYG